MKKLAKRLAAVLMAAVMTVGISMTAFAANPTVEETGTLKVTGSGLWSPADSKGKSVTAIRMFTARVTDGTGENTFDSYVLDSKWKGFFTDNTRFAAVKLAGGISEDTTVEAISEVDLSNAAVAYVKTLQTQDSDQMPTFAHKAQVWARAHADFTSLTQTATAESANDAGDATKGTATFNALTSGYYLVYPEGGSTGDDNRGTDAMLVNVPDTNGTTEATIKSTYPTVDKEVKTTTDGTFAQNGTAQVGDQVTFQLHSQVPDMTDYKTYTFTFNDTLSNGLAFDADSVKVSIGGTSIDKSSDTYTVDEPSTENQNKLTVSFTDLKKIADIKTGQDIVVTYTAHITAAATTDDPAKNTVTVSYSNDPNTTGTGTSQPSESKVYTYQIDIDKYTGTYSDNAERLAGATFQLKTEKSAQAESIQLVKDKENVYHIVADNEKTDAQVEKVAEVTTDATGKITIKGLKAGTYYLYEKEAPAGYNKLTAPVTIVITAADTADLTNFTYTLNGKASTANDATVPVQNNKGQMLPTTGSMGTIGLVALGVAVVLIGVFMPRKKKANR